MHQVVEIDSVFIALAVLLFVLFAIAVLVIVDHKARIPGGEVHDPFSISGLRRDHPIWAWIVSAFLWLVIVSLLAATVLSFSKKIVKEEETGGLLSDLGSEAAAEQLRHFHNSPTEKLYSQGVQPVCYACHGEYPHSKKPMVRTLLNMHTQFVGCMTCHADSKKVPEESMRLQWLNYSGIPVKGKPFGTEIDPNTGTVAATDDYYSKIVAYGVNEFGVEALLEITEESDAAREFLAIRHELTNQQQGAVKKMFHAQVNPIGRFCTRCHASENESFIPFRELGFSEERITALTNLNIIGIVDKYRDFYLPTIFSGDMTEEEKKALVGEERTQPEVVTDDTMEDPRSWWRKQYDTDAR